MSDPLILVPLKAAYRHAGAVEQWAAVSCAAKLLLLTGFVLCVLVSICALFPAVAGWLILAVASSALASSYWLFKRAEKLRGNGVRTLRITFSDTDAMQEAGVPVEWIKKLEQADVLFWSEEDRSAYETANAVVSAAMRRK